MKITIFTSNQARHLSLINELANICDCCYAIIEANTIFPGENKDFYDSTELFRKYFKEVLAAEELLFGKPRFLRSNVNTLIIRPSDLNKLNKDYLKDALYSDIFIVFGSSYVKGWLVDELIEKHAINIHMGLSPYYRGSSCNFWALYDNKPEFVGGTIHKLSKGLDSGPILYHALPSLSKINSPFEFTMNAVKAVQESIIKYIQTGRIFKLNPIKQENNLLIRYSRYSDFKDESIQNFYKKDISIPNINQRIEKFRKASNFVEPYLMK